MNRDMNFWKCCKCSNENPRDVLFCNKCGKQRWAQLGFKPSEAREVMQTITPWYILKKDSGDRRV